MPSIRILVDPGPMQGEMDSVRGMSLRMWFWMEGKQLAPGVEFVGCPKFEGRDALDPDTGGS